MENDNTNTRKFANGKVQGSPARQSAGQLSTVAGSSSGSMQAQAAVSPSGVHTEVVDGEQPEEQVNPEEQGSLLCAILTMLFSIPALVGS